MSKQQPTFVGTTDIGQLEVAVTFTKTETTPHSERASVLRDEAAAFARTIAPSTPIKEALSLLVKAHLLKEEEATALLLPAVWTWGDIPVILERGEITDAELAEKIRGLVGC